MPSRRHSTRPTIAVLALSCTVLALSAPAAAGLGAPPPLLPEPVVRALAGELSGTAARRTVQELSLQPRAAAPEGLARAAAAIRERAERAGLDRIESIRLPADGPVSDKPPGESPGKPPGEAVEAPLGPSWEPDPFEVVTAIIPGADPDLRRQEIVYACRLDLRGAEGADGADAMGHAGGCAAILEVARALRLLIGEGTVPPPRRSLRFVWRLGAPAGTGSTAALLAARPDLAARARAVIEVGRIDGPEDRADSILHVTRSPRSLPTAVNDVAEAFARFVNEQSYAHAVTGEADFPLAEPEGGRRALRARVADFSMGAEHRVWTEGSFRVPAILLDERPERTGPDSDDTRTVDPTRLLRTAFLGAASGYYLATVGEEQVPELLGVVHRHALERIADALDRAGRLEGLDGDEAVNLLRQQAAYERAVRRSIGALAPWPVESLATMVAMDEEVEAVVARGATGEGAGSRGAEAQTGNGTGSGAGDAVCYRRRAPDGPLHSWPNSRIDSRIDSRVEAAGLDRPALLSYRGLWGSGPEYAYEVLNLVDGRRTVRQVRDAVSATCGPIPLETVRSHLATLEAIGVVRCGAPLGLFDMMSADTAPLAARAPGFPPPESPVDLGLGGYTKVLCSAVFVSGREVEEAAENSAFLFLKPEDRPAPADIVVDRERREVRVLRDGRTVRTARFHGDQGCVSLPPGGGGIRFEPVPVESALPDAATTPWPMGDLDARIDPESLGIDGEALEAAVDLAFADPAALTRGLVIVHRGKILAERYAPGHDPDTQLESWSMGKSLGATLIGVLVEQGALDPDAPAPIAAWSDPADPRREIRLIDLLRMSSGLRFYSHQDPEWTPELGYPEHFYVYTGGIDGFAFSASRPAQSPPGTEGRYHNSDPLLLAGIVRQVVTDRGAKDLAEYLTFPQRALFDRIGIRRQVLEPDVAGNFLLSGYDYGTPRNWARLGLLYLNDGVFAGERILPEGWSELVSTPAPAWRAPVYGGGFWLNRDGALALPADAYSMEGAGDQFTIVVPSLDLVVVRMGHLRGNGRGQAALNRALGELRKLLAAAEAGPG